MIWAGIPSTTVNWALWLWQNRKKFKPILDHAGEVTELIASLIGDPSGSLRRIGNTLVLSGPSAGEMLLAFIEQAEPVLDEITRAVDGLQGQSAIFSTLESFRNVSILALGATALTPILLAGAFGALNKRVGTLQSQVASLQTMFAAARQAQLQSGFELLKLGQDSLRSGDRSKARKLLGNSLPLCLESIKYYGNLLGDELNSSRIDLMRVRLQARHLSVAILGGASCQIAMQDDARAFSHSAHEIELLKRSTAWVFREAIDMDPVPFLVPAMAAHGITIESMALLYQQAQDAGAVETKAASVGAWFELHRDQIHRAREPYIGKAKWRAMLLARYNEAVSAIEETNRVNGLVRLVQESQAAHKSTWHVMEEVARAIPPSDAAKSPFTAWNFG